ncbi:MAG: M20/M25/M40 family metallo-hydrolase [Synechococcales bacterium]|nr:M20/M25/M40 family metallo-hydrolase [Synechococcales bacterium]
MVTVCKILPVSMELESLKMRLRSHLDEIARPRDPYLATQGHFYVREYIRQTLSQWGQVETHEVKYSQRSHENLILTVWPTSNPCNLAPMVVGAHYDSVPASPGADDNASGVAVLLELARLLHHQSTRRPVQLIAFDLEEVGLLGSRAYAEWLKQKQQRLKVMLSLEMLGYRTTQRNSQHYPQPLEKFYPDRGDFIALIGNIPTIPMMMHFCHHLRQTGTKSEWLPAGWQGKILPRTRASDHAPFWDVGYPAIMVTDTADLRNPHYHQSSDTIATLDLDFMTGICAGLARAIQVL